MAKPSKAYVYFPHGTLASSVSMEPIDEEEEKREQGQWFRDEWFQGGIFMGKRDSGDEKEGKKIERGSGMLGKGANKKERWCVSPFREKQRRIR